MLDQAGKIQEFEEIKKINTDINPQKTGFLLSTSINERQPDERALGRTLILSGLGYAHEICVASLLALCFP